MLKTDGYNGGGDEVELVVGFGNASTMSFK
jgi:hypothetical protein